MLEGNSEDQPCFVVEGYKKGNTYKGLRHFDCGDKDINKYAKDNLKRDGERDHKNLFVLLNPDNGDELVGFVSVHLSMLGRESIPQGTFLHSLPPAVAVMKISMIAVTKTYQKDGWGKTLLTAALDHVIDVANVAVDIKGVTLDAKADVVEFYQRHRFTVIDDVPDENGTYPMFLSINELRSLDEKRKLIERQEAS